MDTGIYWSIVSDDTDTGQILLVGKDKPLKMDLHSSFTSDIHKSCLA